MEILVEVAESGVNLELVEKIIEMIRNLRFTLEAEIESSKTANIEDGKQSEALITAQTNIVTTQTDIINSLENQLEELGKELEILIGKIDTTDKKLTTKENDLIRIRLAWDTTSMNYHQVIDRIRKDIIVLEYVLRCLLSDDLEGECSFPDVNGCSLTAFSAANYNDYEETLTSGDLPEPLNDNVSSFKLNGECSVNFYEDINAGGESRNYAGDQDWVGFEFFEIFSSFQLIPLKPCQLTLYQNPRSGGFSEAFAKSRETLPLRWADEVSSYRLSGLEGCTAKLYKEANFQGDSVEVYLEENGETSSTLRRGWNDEIRSIEISYTRDE
mmetsp:Transcript_34432/g.31125  ORF Transcript_34432/g.31125 Transcript_34432/m.31125 type:complete len:328 (+) Transcript_34432:676-1659(+)